MVGSCDRATLQASGCVSYLLKPYSDGDLSFKMEIHGLMFVERS